MGSRNSSVITLGTGDEMVQASALLSQYQQVVFDGLSNAEFL